MENTGERPGEPHNALARPASRIKFQEPWAAGQSLALSALDQLRNPTWLSFYEHLPYKSFARKHAHLSRLCAEGCLL